MQKIVDEIDKAHQRKREEYPDSKRVYFTVVDGSYSFDCYVDCKGNKEIVVINEKNCDRCYPNVEEYLTANTLDWDDIELEPVEEYDYWNEHGFRDERDYINYRYN